MNKTDQSHFEGALIRATVETVRPFARRLLASGIPFGRLERHLREMFVRVAESDLALPEKPATDSRISLLTGINRKEVRRIRSAAGEAAPRSFSMNRAVHLIGRWLTDPQATDRGGNPLPIPYQAEEGASFMKLARQVTGDLAPRVLLDELVRSGAVEMLEGNRVAVRHDVYVPKVDRSEKLQILAEDPPELVETVMRNIFAEKEEEPLLQRKIYYDNVGSDALKRVRAEMRREGERFLRRANRQFAKYDRDRNPRAAGGRRTYAGLGVYFFDRPEPEPDRPAGERPTPRRPMKKGKRS